MRNWEFPVCSRCKLWIYWFPEKPRFEVLVNIWQRFWRHLQSKSFCWNFHCWKTSSIDYYILKHNLFHQSDLGRDVELQKTHIVQSKTTCDVMKFSTHSAELCLGSKLVNWYQDATSDPYGQLWINLLPRTDDRLHFCTNSGSDASNVYIMNWLKIIKSLDDEHTKSLYSPSVPIIFSQRQKSFPSVSSKWVYPVFCKGIASLLKGNPHSKKHHVAKFQSDVPLPPLERTTWGQRTDVLDTEQDLQ